jgi:hypothetical protein
MNNCNFVVPDSIAHVARVYGFAAASINGFNDIIFPVKQFVANKLNGHRTIVKSLNSENGNILCIVSV